MQDSPPLVQMVLDSETTGIGAGHRIIELGVVELVQRKLTGREYYCLLNPQRDIDEGAIRVHGINLEKVKDQPFFGDIVSEFLAFIKGHELIIHNADFDVSMINYELSLLSDSNQDYGKLEDYCSITDSLKMARRRYSKQLSLDALCSRFNIQADRSLHGALLDSRLLAQVYLAMTGGQKALFKNTGVTKKKQPSKKNYADVVLPIAQASEADLKQHENMLDAMEAKGVKPLWRQ